MKPHTGAAARENPQDPSVIARQEVGCSPGPGGGRSLAGLEQRMADLIRVLGHPGMSWASQVVQQ